MNLLIILLSIFGLTFFIKESSGPFDLMDKLRNWLMLNKYVGAFFYKLLSCYFCTGFWAGIIIYTLTTESIKLTLLPVWGLAGGTVSLILDAVLTRLHRE